MDITLTTLQVDDSICMYSMPMIPVVNGSISCSINGSRVVVGSAVLLSVGSHIVVCIISSECFEDQRCLFEIKVDCEVSELYCDSLEVVATHRENACIDSSIITGSPCGAVFDPVYGCDGNTYSNDCEAKEAGVTIVTQGECDGASPPTAISDKCCYNIDIENNWGSEIVELEVSMLDLIWIFNTVTLDPSFSFGTYGSLNQKMCISSSTLGGIPAGVSVGAITACFAPITVSPSTNPLIEFSWKQAV